MPWNACGPFWMAVLAMSEQAPSKDLLARLRDPDTKWTHGNPCYEDLRREAADEIERLCKIEAAWAGIFGERDADNAVQWVADLLWKSSPHEPRLCPSCGKSAESKRINGCHTIGCRFGETSHEPGSGQAEIVTIQVIDGKIVGHIMKAPGLPDGFHDLFCEPMGTAQPPGDGL